MLFGLERPIEGAEQLPALTLAWVGDAVYELYVRTRLMKTSKNARTLSRACVALVNHSHQSRLLGRLEAHLNERERNVVHRGRNSKGSVPKNGDLHAYRRATGVEALVGYLYLSGQEERLEWLLAQVDEMEEENSE